MIQSGNILLVDDEEELRRTVARIFRNAGFDITTCASGAEALALLAQQAFDIVFLDIRMPGMSGLEVLRAVHAQTPDLPVVLFTAQPDLGSALEALRAGATDYFLKPLQPQRLIDRTRRILTDRRTELRKREILSQVEALHAELRGLEDGQAKAAPTDGPRTGQNERYLSVGKLILDLHANRLSVDDRTITLAPASFAYLRVLAQHAPSMVDYRTLVAEALGYDVEYREAQQLAKWHIHQIRQAIDTEAPGEIILMTVRGEGYRLVAD